MLPEVDRAAGFFRFFKRKMGGLEFYLAAGREDDFKALVQDDRVIEKIVVKPKFVGRKRRDQSSDDLIFKRLSGREPRNRAVFFLIIRVDRSIPRDRGRRFLHPLRLGRDECAVRLSYADVPYIHLFICRVESENKFAE